MTSQVPMDDDDTDPSPPQARSAEVMHLYARTPLQRRLDLLRNVPPRMASAKQWLMFKLVPRGQPGKWDKVPFYVNGVKRHGAQGTPEDRRRLVTLDRALEVLSERTDDFDGVGFAILKDGAAFCIDFDGSKSVERWRDHIDMTWSEQSVSGAGAHAWYGSPIGYNGKDLRAGVEFYDTSGFIAVTGKVITRDPARARLAPGTAAAGVVAGVASPGATTSSRAGPGGATLPRNIPAPATRADLRHARAVLAQLDPDLPYPDWLELGQALHSGDPSEDGPTFKLWDEWSARGLKYPGTDALLRKWRGFTATGGITMRTLFAYEAKKPQTKKARSDDADYDGATEPSIVSVDEVLANDHPEPRCFVSDLLYEGLVLLVAQQKVGKTFFITQLGIALASGRPFLGLEVKEPMRVLLLLLEEGDVTVDEVTGEQVIPAVRLKHRLRGMGLDPKSVGDRLKIVFEVPDDESGGADWLRRQMDHYDAVLIDSAAKLAQVYKGDRRDVWKGDYRFIEHYRSTRRTGKLIVLIQHAKKGMNLPTADAADAAAGTGGIMAAADGSIVLTRPRDDTWTVKPVRMEVTGRDRTISEQELRFDGQTLHWVRLGPWTHMSPSETAILRALHAHPHGMNYTSLSAETGIGQNTLEVHVSKLRSRGVIASQSQTHEAGRRGAMPAIVMLTDEWRQRVDTVLRMEFAAR